MVVWERVKRYLTILAEPVWLGRANRTREQGVCVCVCVCVSIFFPSTDDIHCDSIHSSPIAVCCFDDGYVEKQPMALNEYFVEYWLKELQESIDRCTGRRDITEIMLKHTVNYNNFITRTSESRAMSQFLQKTSLSLMNYTYCTKLYLLFLSVCLSVCLCVCLSRHILTLFAFQLCTLFLCVLTYCYSLINMSCYRGPAWCRIRGP